MKKSSLVLLILIAVGIAVLISFSGNLTTYDTVASAQQKKNKFVHLIGRLDTTQAMLYDPQKDPNLFTFSIIDSLGGTAKVIYHNVKPKDIEKSARLVLKGKMQDTYFECSEILMKCPSKYKDQNASQEKMTAALMSP